ncbi:MAG: diacylglycerol kinase family lipid kinase [Bacteroidetes bacterium]|nr:MAG: diacylglycerol kinase family lipid kinase [Bacteroidota bacterium]
MKKKIRIIINPISGTNKQIKAEKAIEANLNTEMFDSEIVYSNKKGHLTTLAKDAVEKNYDAVIVVGGDGSINEAAQGLIGSKTSLGIIPIGSGNGFARHLNIPMSLPNAVERINQFRIKSVDTVKVNEQSFVSISGLGFDAHIAEKFSLAKGRGLWNYTKISIREFFSYSEKEYTISIDETTFEKKAFMIVSANANQFGNNFVIAPQAKIDDGQLDVCFVSKPELLQIPYVLFKILKKEIDQTKFVQIKKAKKIKIELNDKVFMNIDGEAIQQSKIINIAINPLSLSVIY